MASAQGQRSGSRSCRRRPLCTSGASAAPFVAALTDAVLPAAVRAAEHHGGRLPVPLVAALDEAANVVRIGDLPQLYSHLGSRGVVPLTLLPAHVGGAGPVPGGAVTSRVRQLRRLLAALPSVAANGEAGRWASRP